MKKQILFVVATICIMAFTISCASAAREKVIVPELSKQEFVQESKLPALLEIIEDEAFEGTALTKVDLPEKVRSIGEKAFATISTLREIKIPLSTGYIASNAFEGSNRITITAPTNSYARKFARTHGLPFSPIVLFCASVQTPTNSIYTTRQSTGIIETETIVFKPETQWGQNEENSITQKEQLIANHVQGRSPPIAL